MPKTRTEKIESIQSEIAQLENRCKQLIQEQKQQDRKERTRRLCKRAGLFESLLPETIPLTDEQFKTYLEKTILTEHSRRILAALATQPPAPKDAQHTATPTTQPTVINDAKHTAEPKVQPTA